MDLVRELIDYVKHPSVSTDPAFKAGMDGAREHICGLLKQAGLEVEVVPTPLHPWPEGMASHRPLRTL
jgi:hypothetical protein